MSYSAREDTMEVSRRQPIRKHVVTSSQVGHAVSDILYTISR